MKITDVRTFVVGNPPPSFGGRYFVFVKLVTDGGVEGLGEVYCLPFHPRVVVAMIEDLAGRYLVGQDPTRIESLWRRVYSAGYGQRPDLSVAGILSGLEMACWDILGKETGKPVHALLGGRVHERLRSYTYLYPGEGETADFYHDAERSAERAAEYVRQGFTAIKFDPAGPYSAFDPRMPDQESLARSEQFCRLIRAAVGGGADLLFGTHGQFTPAGALRLARRLEPYDPLWLEEPTPPEMPEQMALVARGTTIPVAAGERLATKYEFARLLDAGAAAILQPNLGRVGGLLEAKKIAGLAEARYAQVAPHLYCGPVVGAANIQLAATLPNFLILESIQTWGGFHAELLKTPIRWQEGYVLVPDAPGLGVELDEAVALAHPYEGEELHLDMAQDPVPWRPAE
ncbi:L-alanine-DL-glutamate epimerase [Tistlia consotensis]|uniref:L-alanine-DL-glutamate epimerase n=1 Tax=Tistlia consotensis USBA 355 TaxID=560819 RepID=A0A1Y6CMH4_9PROT|nr:mandelate racemase/muconate lactonizing enzyme family protein [Tistlia consotensis]SMF76971.1 L-alanine-DL-glutamate epimerase [Tistlia consotensis USBA 355]SNS13641.1 L-alanine-DL-glutamate epimerase [Tistlia consotensis]